MNLKQSKTQSIMEKVITGTIEYTVTIEENGEHITEYRSSIDNDLAAFCISQFVMENACVGLKEARKGLKGQVKAMFTKSLEKAIAGREGIKVVTDQLLSMYDEYMASQKEYKDFVTEKGMEDLAVNPVELNEIKSADETNKD